MIEGRAEVARVISLICFPPVCWSSAWSFVTPNLFTPVRPPLSLVVCGKSSGTVSFRKTETLKLIKEVFHCSGRIGSVSGALCTALVTSGQSVEGPGSGPQLQCAMESLSERGTTVRECLSGILCTLPSSQTLWISLFVWMNGEVTYVFLLL